MPLLDALFGGRSFFIKNLDSGQEIQGQFPAQNLKKEKGARYSKTSALNRQTPITQFISGEDDRITFQILLFNRDEIFGQAEDDLELLESWIERDSQIGRPPICSFSVGNGFVSMGECVIEKVVESYMQPTFFGKLHGVQIDLTISRYKEFSLEGEEPGETRYARAKERDYYEMLTQIEYNSPELGDVIRKRHPDKANIEVADIIKLPSIEAIRTERVEQKSVSLKTAYGRKETPQRALRIYMFEQRNRTYVSHIL
jgi:phage protein U